MKIRINTNWKTVSRFNEIVKIFRKYGFGKFIGQSGVNRYNPFTKKKIDPYNEMIDEDFPERLRLMFQELGTTYIKLGQLLSTRPDIVGTNIAKELTKLQDNNPPVEFNEIEEVIEEELGDSISNLFKNFSKEPIATASIGQVHEGYLMTGEHVAIKVQKKGLETLIETDLKIMHFISKRIDKRISKASIYNIPAIVDEFERTIHKEIDYNIELRNMKHLEYDLRNNNKIHIPKSYSEYTTTKVLTTEYIDGLKLSEVIESDDPKYNKPLIAKRGVNAYFEQIFINGFFHADPHPSNIIIEENNVICFIDEGMMGILDDKFRKELAELMIYFTEENIEGLIKQLIYMEIIPDTVNMKVLRRDLTDLFSKYYGTELKRMTQAIEDLIKLMKKYNVRLPSEFVLMARGISMIEELGLKLDPEIDIVTILRPIARRMITKRYSPSRLFKLFRGNLFDIEHLFNVLPGRLNNIIYKIEEGEIKVQIEIYKLDRIATRISLALIISALLIGSSLAMLIDVGPTLFGMPLLGFIGFFISFILSIMTVIEYRRED